MAFTSLDKALTDRIVRLVITLAGDHKTSSTINGAFPNTAEGRHDKRRHDALCRDAADLKSLQARMIKEVGDASCMPKTRAKAEKTEQVQEAAPADREHPLGSAPGPEQVGGVVEPAGFICKDCNHDITQCTCLVKFPSVVNLVAEQKLDSTVPPIDIKNVGPVVLTPPEEKLLDAAEVLFNGNALAVVGTAEEKF